MRSKTKEMINKVKDLLTDMEYAQANLLAEKCNLSATSVYRIIRKMRMEGIGVLPTPKGYTLSKYAKRNDDVHFLRCLNGRRTSDFIALRAAEPDIRKRWNTVADRRNLNLIVGPLQVNVKSLAVGSKLLLNNSNGNGVGKI